MSPTSTETVLTYLKLVGRDSEKALSMLSKDKLQYVLAPSSLGVPAWDHPTFTKILTGAFKSLDVTVHEAFESADGRRVCVDAKGQGIKADGGEYKNEYIFVFHLNDDGKIEYVKEFVDSDLTKAAMKG
ncbi:hypothetical protein DFJ74DRAFT_663116 [Hyaloraphidium curvatum]|nr:hypothetical protein DFJ74DRAFT_663116 [Hyaloraphidium curvatum]